MKQLDEKSEQQEDEEPRKWIVKGGCLRNVFVHHRIKLHLKGMYLRLT